jgi:hypothetical protein
LFLEKLSAKSLAEFLWAVVKMMEERKTLLSSSKPQNWNCKKGLEEIDLQIQGLKTTIQRLRSPFGD